MVKVMYILEGLNQQKDRFRVMPIKRGLVLWTKDG